MPQQFWAESVGLSKAEVIILCILHAIIGTVGFFLNLLLNVAIIRSRWTQQAETTMLLLNLSVINFLFSAVHQPIHIWYLSTDTPLRIVAHIHIGIALVLRMAATNGCTLITIDRFMYTSFPLRYVTWVTEERVKQAIACAWIISGLLVLIVFQTGDFTKTFPFVGLNVALVLTLYIKIFLTARKQRHRIAQQYPHTGKTSGSLSKHRGSATIAVIVGMSLASWLPIVIVKTVVGNTSPAVAWVILVPSLNTCLEPYIYYRRIGAFRSAINKLLAKQDKTRAMELVEVRSRRPDSNRQM